MHTESDRCPECGSNEIQVIDVVKDATTWQSKNLVVCWTCNHSWHEPDDEEEAMFAEYEED